MVLHFFKPKTSKKQKHKHFEDLKKTTGKKFHSVQKLQKRTNWTRFLLPKDWSFPRRTGGIVKVEDLCQLA